MTNIVKATEEFVLHLFDEKLASTFTYHNFTHTKRVYKSINEIIENSQINVKDTLILQLSAWLHDTGYTVSRDGHEEASVVIAREWLTSQKVEQDIIESVEKCILATKFTEEPKSHLEEIIRDADASHFGKEYFDEASSFLREELRLQGIKDHNGSQWREENITVLKEKHRFYTDYAIQNWQPVKEKNLSNLLKKKAKKLKESQLKEELKAKYKAEAKNASPERGIQTFYRVALRNHIKLSDIADTKANILLSVNAIIISVVLANLLSKLDKNPFLIWPTAIFVISATVTMVLAVLATRPNVTRGEFTREDVENKKVNLTFFGNFHKMKLSEYQWAIDELLKDKDYLYSSMTKDLYFLGKVLDRKYRILRMTYTFFVVGIIISIIAFAISFGISEQAVEQVTQEIIK